MYQFGNQAFLSYRGRDYPMAEHVRQWLLSNQYCHSVVLFPRNSLSSEREVLLTYEYFELSERIFDHLAASQTFIYLDRPGYWASYFTQIEVAQWRRFSKKNPPEAYPVSEIDRDGKPIFGQRVLLEPMSENQKRLLAGISVGTNRRMQQMPLTPPTTWSKYAKNCFLVCCAGCGEYLLISQKAVYSAIKSHTTITCPHDRPHQGSKEIGFREEVKTGQYYRKPVILEQNGQQEPRLLGINEIIHILVMNDPPPGIPVVTVEGETLWSDLQKLGAYVGVLGAIGAGVLLAIWLDKDK
jgi:hypothetical protein